MRARMSPFTRESISGFSSTIRRSSVLATASRSASRSAWTGSTRSSSRAAS
jgi:hypothetical protein